MTPPAADGPTGQVHIVDGVVEGPDAADHLVELGSRVDRRLDLLIPGVAGRVVRITEAAPWLDLLVQCSLGAPDDTAIWGARRATGDGLLDAVRDEGIPVLQHDLDVVRTGRRITGRMSGDVLFEPMAAAALVHACVGHTVEADNMASYGAELGLGLGDVWTPDAALTIVDDPTSAGHVGAYPTDDEGTPAYRTLLVADGRWEGLLTSAAHQPPGHGLTGHGRRAVGAAEAMPRNSVIWAEGGRSSWFDLVWAINDGFYCGTPRQGLSVGASVWMEFAWARRIAGGRLTDEVYRDVEIRARKVPLMRRLTGIGDDLTFFDSCFPCSKNGQDVPVTQGAPHLSFRALTLCPPDESASAATRGDR